MNRIGNSIAREIICAAIVLSCTSVLPGVEFAGGTGEPNDPYQIATAEQLIAIDSDPNLLNKHFVLVASIDLSGMTWSTPVISSFSGSFDGNGHTIRGLIARGPGPQGLFGQVQNTGRVMNLSMVDVDLTSTNVVGALAAYNFGAVSHGSSTGSIVGLGYDTGGLVGSNRGMVTGSFSAAEVTGYGPVGGLVGSNQGGALIHCHSTGIVFGNYAVGGLAGSNHGSIRASYADSDVMAWSNLGGLAGNNAGSVSSCYSAGTVVGGTYAGGLVGENGGKASSCYSIASLTSQATPTATTVGGLVGVTHGGSWRVVMDSYFLAPADGGGPDNRIGTPLTLAQMEQEANFAAWDFWGTDADGTADRWFMPAGSPPVLAWQTETTGLQLVPDVGGLPLDRARAALTAAGFVPGAISHDYDHVLRADFVIHADPSSIAPVGAIVGLVLSAGGTYDWADNPGDGTEANPYQIQTAGQLESLGDHPELLDGHFVLAADLDMSGRTYSTALIAPDTAFTGVFDGQGHTIRNFTILADRRDYVGLFDTVAETGRISRLNLREATVKIPSAFGTRESPTIYIGVLAGYNYGAIADCSVSESILIGQTSGDGLVGVNQGSIVNSDADITVVNVSGSIR